jgi:hypothetical protein
LEGEVEAVQALVVGQPRQLEGVAEAAALAQADFFFQDQVEEVEVAHGGLLGPGDQGVEVAGEVGQPQAVGVLTDAGGDQLTHRSLR